MVGQCSNFLFKFVVIPSVAAAQSLGLQKNTEWGTYRRHFDAQVKKEIRHSDVRVQLFFFIGNDVKVE